MNTVWEDLIIIAKEYCLIEVKVKTVYIINQLPNNLDIISIIKKQYILIIMFCNKYR